MADCSISIVIPFYNGWESFQRCKESLEKQSCWPDQIVIGDDCSTDGSFEKLHDYASKTSLPVIIFRNAQNKGPGFTRAQALQYVTSAYVTFCDCDDWYELDFIKVLKEKIKQSMADLIIYDNYKIIGNQKEKANITQVLTSVSKQEILALYPMSLCRLVVSNKIIQTVFFPELRYGEDGAVVPQIIAKADKIDILQEAFYNYYYRTNSVSNKPSQEAFENMLEAFKIVRQRIDSMDYYDEIEFIGVRFICYAATLSALKAGVPFNTIRMAIQAFTMDYPQWNKNKYIQKIKKSKKIYLFLVYKQWLLCCKLFSLAHGVWIRYR